MNYNLLIIILDSIIHDVLLNDPKPNIPIGLVGCLLDGINEEEYRPRNKLPNEICSYPQQPYYQYISVGLLRMYQSKSNYELSNDVTNPVNDSHTDICLNVEAICDVIEMLIENALVQYDIFTCAASVSDNCTNLNSSVTPSPNIYPECTPSMDNHVTSRRRSLNTMSLKTILDFCVVEANDDSSLNFNSSMHDLIPELQSVQISGVLSESGDSNMSEGCATDKKTMKLLDQSHLVCICDYNDCDNNGSSGTSLCLCPQNVLIPEFLYMRIQDMFSPESDALGLAEIEVNSNANRVLSMSAIYTIMGIRNTCGTVHCVLPPCKELLNSFQKLHNPHAAELELGSMRKEAGSCGMNQFVSSDGINIRPKKKTHRSILTTGARALLKHAVRYTAKSSTPKSSMIECQQIQGKLVSDIHAAPLVFTWGGVPKGNEIAKNQIALDKVKYILNHACWISCHILPTTDHCSVKNNSSGGNCVDDSGPIDRTHCESTSISRLIIVLELRIASGHGARWELGDKLMINRKKSFTDKKSTSGRGKISSKTDSIEFRGFLEPKPIWNL